MKGQKQHFFAILHGECEGSMFLMPLKGRKTFVVLAGLCKMLRKGLFNERFIRKGNKDNCPGSRT